MEEKQRKLTGLPEAYALAYEEAKRALEEQDRTVTELRARAGVLMAAAAITTSFLGGRALVGSSVGLASWIATGAFGLVGLAVLAILWPRRDWEFSLSAANFIEIYIEPAHGEPLPLPEIHRDLALHMSTSWNTNREQLRLLQAAFRAAAVLLVAEVVAWFVALAT